MEISDDDLLAEARAMALYIRFLERHNTALEAQVAALSAGNARTPEDSDQHKP